MTLDEIAEEREHIFDCVKNYIWTMCADSDLPLPDILYALPTDPCDVTHPDYIRLNIDAYNGDDFEYYAHHVFAHWLCDLHCYGAEDMADRVADAIANLLTAAHRYDTMCRKDGAE